MPNRSVKRVIRKTHTVKMKEVRQMSAVVAKKDQTSISPSDMMGRRPAIQEVVIPLGRLFALEFPIQIYRK